MKATLNRSRNTKVSPEFAGADVTERGSGKDGVAAINVSFADLALGSTTIVTGGAMRGSTMLFTADESGFSAYHASASNRTGWKAADEAASSIAKAQDHFRLPDPRPSISKPRKAALTLFFSRQQSSVFGSRLQL
jgi:hypothetical protein